MQLGKAYPPPGAAAAVIDLDRYDERQLMSQSSGAYPLIVRMETVTEKGLAEGHSLQVMSLTVLSSSGHCGWPKPAGVRGGRC